MVVGHSRSCRLAVKTANGVLGQSSYSLERGPTRLRIGLTQRRTIKFDSSRLPAPSTRLGSRKVHYRLVAGSNDGLDRLHQGDASRILEAVLLDLVGICVQLLRVDLVSARLPWR